MDDFKTKSYNSHFCAKVSFPQKKLRKPMFDLLAMDTPWGTKRRGKDLFAPTRPSHPLKHFHPTPKCPASSLGLHKLAFCLLILFASPDFKGMTEWFSKDENTKDASCHLGKFTYFFFKDCVPQMMEQPCVFLLFLHTIHFLFSPEGYWHIVYIFTL